MKKLVSSLAIIGLLLFSVTAYAERITPSSNYVTKQVKVGPFEGISTGTSIDVVYTQASGSPKVEIYAPDNIAERVEIRIENNILKVRFQPNTNIYGKHKTEVRIAAPAVKSLKASSSGDITLTNGLKTSGEVSLKASSSGDIKGGNISCDNLVLGASSSGDIELQKVTCSSLSASASSSGDVEVKEVKAQNISASSSSSGDVILKSGSCQNASYSASSSGDVEAKGVKANQVVATASSSGDVYCHATESLTAKASTSGEVGYKGDPKHLQLSKRGVHKIR